MCMNTLPTEIAIPCWLLPGRRWHSGGATRHRCDFCPSQQAADDNYPERKGKGHRVTNLVHIQYMYIHTYINMLYIVQCNTLDSPRSLLLRWRACPGAFARFQSVHLRTQEGEEWIHPSAFNNGSTLLNNVYITSDIYLPCRIFE